MNTLIFLIDSEKEKEDDDDNEDEDKPCNSLFTLPTVDLCVDGNRLSRSK